MNVGHCSSSRILEQAALLTAHVAAETALVPNAKNCSWAKHGAGENGDQENGP